MFKKHLTHAKAFMTGHFRDIGLDVGIFSQIRLDFQLFPTWELFIPSVGITCFYAGNWESPILHKYSGIPNTERENVKRLERLRHSLP